MTFTELMDITYRCQTVMLILGEDSIVGTADVLNNYICIEAAESEVTELKAEDNMLKVWVK